MRELVRDIARRVMLASARAVLRLTDDTTRLQTVQLGVLPGEVLDGVEHLQPYGFSSHALPGADVALVSLGGQRQHSLAIVIDDRRYRPTGLEEGEVLLYSRLDEAGNPHRVILTEDREIRAQCGSAFIELSSSKCVIDAAVIELRGATKTVRIP